MAMPNYYQPYGAFQSYAPMFQQNYQSMQSPAVTQIPNTIQQNQQQVMQQSMPVINGKIVDGIETVRIQDVPIGSYGVYPKADSSVIYVKTWQQDGTTKIDEYEKVKPIEDYEDDPINFSKTLDGIYDSIRAIGKKIDNIKFPTTTTSTPMKRKKVEEDE